MAERTIGALLDMALDFETSLQNFYTDIRDHSKDNGIRLLAYYLCRRRRHLAEILTEGDPKIIDALRETTLDTNSDFSPAMHFDVIKASVMELDGKGLLEAAIRYDNALLDLYSLILRHQIAYQARDAFNELIQAEKTDITMLKKMQAMHYF